MQCEQPPIEQSAQMCAGRGRSNAGNMRQFAGWPRGAIGQCQQYRRARRLGQQAAKLGHMITIE